MISLFGTIDPPLQNAYFQTTQGEGLFLFISNLFKLAGVIAGMFLIVQILTAGYGYLSANGDIKKTEMAWNKIWQSALGMVIIASAFVLAGIVSRLTGIDILNPTIYGPN
jgi:hypothetical protein